MPDTITGTLTHRDTKRHVPHRFTVPEGASELRVQFAYTPVKLASALPINEISLSLFGPAGARGARHNNRNLDIVLAPGYATPGYLPGAPEPGEWTLVIDVHRVLPGPEVSYTLEISVAETPSVAPRPTFQPGHTAPRGPGWYRGDLHAHSLHSDASWDVPDLVAFARGAGLDFVTLSDHNTVSGVAELHSHRSDDLLTLGALELTTFHGHALAHGLPGWTEWRVNPPGGPATTMPAIAEGIAQAGGLFITAHPMSLGSPWCSGCFWDYGDMTPGPARHVEVWNSDWRGTSHNEQALQLYYLWLNQRHRLVATAGTDIHRASDAEARLGFNVVYAEDLSESAILEGLRRGHLYLSSGPDLKLTATNGAGEHFTMGDRVHGDDISIGLEWSGADPTDEVRIVEEAQTVRTLLGSSGQEPWTLNDAPTWLTAELRDAEGNLRALTNPLFFT